MFVFQNKLFNQNWESTKKKRFQNPFTFSNNNIKTFILLIRKGADNCEWEKFNETSLRGKEE